MKLFILNLTKILFIKKKIIYKYISRKKLKMNIYLKNSYLTTHLEVDHTLYLRCVEDDKKYKKVEFYFNHYSNKNEFKLADPLIYFHREIPQPIKEECSIRKITSSSTKIAFVLHPSFGISQYNHALERMLHYVFPNYTIYSTNTLHIKRFVSNGKIESKSKVKKFYEPKEPILYLVPEFVINSEEKTINIELYI